MAETSFPFDSIDTTESQFSQWARNIGEGVKGSAAGTELKVFADSTGMLVKLPAGQAMVRGHYYINTAQMSLTITTAHATLPRIDAVVVELDPTANTIVAKVVAGTPGASPVAPTLTQTDTGVWQQLLATVAVGAAVSTIAAGNVTDQRLYLGGVTLTGVQTLTNKTLASPVLNAPDITSPIETTTISTSAATGTITYNTATQADVYNTTAGSANFILNFTNVSTTLAVGKTKVVAFRNTVSSTTSGLSSIQIEGTAQAIKWQGGGTPTASTNGVDVYTFAITRLTSSYVVFASKQNFA